MSAQTTNRPWRRDPRLCTAQMLKSTFVGSDEVVRRLLDQITQSATTPNKHYNLLVGAGGIGKTHTISIVVRRMLREVAGMRVAWLPEQPDGFASESLLFRAIAEALGGGVDPALVEGDRDAVTNAARQAIRRHLGELPFLLVIENLDEVLGALGEVGQRSLRGFLQEERNCTVLASARRVTADLADQGRPFFGFFSVHRMAEMSGAETIDLVTRLEHVRGGGPQADLVASPDCRSTFLALHHMVGGLPGRYVSLLGAGAQLDQPDSLLLRALDEHAIHHLARVQHLSWQQRLILDWLARNRGAVPVKEVARACLISEQTVSPQLRGLLRLGFVCATPIGRQTYYEVADALVGIDTDYALELFSFLRSWFEDAEAAMAGEGAIASRLRQFVVNEAEGLDPRRLLDLPQLERGLVQLR